MTHLLPFFLILATQLYTTLQESPNGSLNIDLALIIHERAQMWLEAIRSGMEDEFQSFFPVAPNGSRVGALINLPRGKFAATGEVATDPSAETRLHNRFEWSVAMNMTDDPKEYKDGLHEMYHAIRLFITFRVRSPVRDKSWFGAFKMAEERLFVEEPSGGQRPRVILLITDPFWGALNDSLHVDLPSLTGARKMRERGIHMFALYTTYTDDKVEVADRLTDILGDRRNLKNVYHGGIDFFRLKTFQWLKDRIVDVLCGREQRCFFLEPQKQCQKAWYTPNLTDAQGNCTKVRGFTTPWSNEDKPCSFEECKATCDDLWSIKCSESNCGKEPRNDEPRWEQLLNCDRSVRCPACITKTTCNEIHPPEFYYDDFDGAHRCANAGSWVVLVAVVIVSF